MRKTRIILSVALALLFLLNFSLAKLSDKKGQETEQPVRPEIEQGKDILPASQTREPEVLLQGRSVASSFMPDERKTSEINPDATKSEKGSVQEKNLPVLSGATPDRGVRSEDLTQPKQPESKVISCSDIFPKED